MRGLRAVIAILGLVAVLVLAPGLASATPSPTVQQSLSDALAAEINAVRAAAGLPPLVAAAGLERSSKAHAVDMGTSGFFSHSSRDGTSFAERIARYYPRNGSRRYLLGETLFWSSGPVTAVAVVSGWLNSRSHRAVILSSGLRQLGVTAIYLPAAPSFFGGRDVTVVVADYGRR